jgi:2-(1,2-epoxy-1,2-dihydrophenyl)acetyl-CoA isomerase
VTYEHIIVQQQNGLATLTLNRPASLNAFTVPMVAEMIRALDRLRDEQTARALLINAAGRAFCSGADLSGADHSAGVSTDDAGAPLESHFNPFLERLMDLQLPVVCAVNGAAAGAGCSVALAADITIAARSAYFLQAFVNIGLVPDVGSTWMLPRLAGRARAQAMMMLGERIPAEKAEQWGLIYKVVDDEALAQEAQALATKLANGPTRAYALIRQGLRQSLECSLTESLRIERFNQLQAGRTADVAEGIGAFLARRPAAFKGR